jgi:hypothetical protein
MDDEQAIVIAEQLASNRPVTVHAITGDASIDPSALAAWRRGEVAPDVAGLRGVGIGKVINNVIRENTAGRQIISIRDVGSILDEVDSNRNYNYIIDVVASLKETEVLSPFGAPGKHYLVQTWSQLNNLIDRFNDYDGLRGGWAVREGDDNDKTVYYQFNNAAHVHAHASSPEQANNVLKKDILLRDAEGIPTLAARIAASLLSRVKTKDSMHLFLADVQERAAYEEAMLLLTTIDPTCHYLIQPIYVDYDKNPSEDAMTVSFCKQMEHATEELLRRLDRFQDKTPMRTDEAAAYTNEEYGEPPEFDIKALAWLIPHMDHIFPQGIKGDVWADGHGPYTYLAHAMLPYLVKGGSGRILACDISVPGLAMAIGLRTEGQRDHAKLAAEAFEREMVRLGGEKYRGSAEEYRNRLDLVAADISQPMRGSCQVNIDGFTRYASCFTLNQYYKLVASASKTVGPGGIMISGAFTNKTGWRRFPSAPVTEEHIRKAHAAANMSLIDTLVIPPLGDSAEHHSDTVITIAHRIGRIPTGRLVPRDRILHPNDFPTPVQRDWL